MFLIQKATRGSIYKNKLIKFGKFQCRSFSIKKNSFGLVITVIRVTYVSCEKKLMYINFLKEILQDFG